MISGLHARKKILRDPGAAQEVATSNSKDHSSGSRMVAGASVGVGCMQTRTCLGSKKPFMPDPEDKAQAEGVLCFHGSFLLTVVCALHDLKGRESKDPR